MGYTRPTPIQAEAIPVGLAGRDLIGCASTGTGKTAAFVLPILQRLAAAARGKCRALVIAPTRELALQIDEQVLALGYHVGLSAVSVVGGLDMRPQERALRAGAEIVVATPGRLLDHQRFGYVDLAQLEILVLDEADRTQGERIAALESFRRGDTAVLVATDVAARGIDVEGISHVINVNVPFSPDDYIHRGGRTARAGAGGEVITFVSPGEERELV